MAILKRRRTTDKGGMIIGPGGSTQYYLGHYPPIDDARYTAVHWHAHPHAMEPNQTSRHHVGGCGMFCASGDVAHPHRVIVREGRNALEGHPGRGG